MLVIILDFHPDAPLYLNILTLNVAVVDFLSATSGLFNNRSARLAPAAYGRHLWSPLVGAYYPTLHLPTKVVK
jgi:hypothetical protein